MFTIVRPRSVGSFFISRSRERAKLRAVPSSRSTSCLSRSPIEIRCRRGGGAGGRRSSRITRTSVIAGHLLFAVRNEQHAVDLVDLDELHLDALVAGRRQVLADVVGTDRKLSVTAIDEARELHARGTTVIEERVDRGANRAAGVEDVVDGDARPSAERELELAVADDRLRVEWRLSPTSDVDVVAVEGDVERPEREFDVGSLGDQPPKPMGDRDSACMDPDERGPVELRIPLDDLVRDANEGALDRLGVEEDLRGRQPGRGQSATRVESLRRA